MSNLISERLAQIRSAVREGDSFCLGRVNWDEHKCEVVECRPAWSRLCTETREILSVYAAQRTNYKVAKTLAPVNTD